MNTRTKNQDIDLAMSDYDRAFRAWFQALHDHPEWVRLGEHAAPAVAQARAALTAAYDALPEQARR